MQMFAGVQCIPQYNNEGSCEQYIVVLITGIIKYKSKLIVHGLGTEVLHPPPPPPSKSGIILFRGMIRIRIEVFPMI